MGHICFYGEKDKGLIPAVVSCFPNEMHGK